MYDGEEDYSNEEVSTMFICEKCGCRILATYLLDNIKVFE
jgi:hypothetical protein